jgi:hypothetical protein
MPEETSASGFLHEQEACGCEKKPLTKRRVYFKE